MNNTFSGSGLGFETNAPRNGEQGIESDEALSILICAATPNSCEAQTFRKIRLIRTCALVKMHAVKGCRGMSDATDGSIKDAVLTERARSR